MSYVTLKDGAELYIRTAVETDASEIVQLFNIMGGESDNLTFGLNDYYFNENQQKIFIKAMRERHNSLFLVGVINDKIIGYLTFTTMQRGKLMHRGDMGIAVLSACWGIGVGSALVDYLIKWAKDGGEVGKIELQVRADNLRALELYKKWGFEIEGKISRGMKINNIYYDIYYMGKCIGR